MAQHTRLINGRLLLAGRRPWHEWRTDQLLDVCDALREDEHRFIIGLKANVPIPQLPHVDVRRVGFRTPAGYGWLDVEPAPAVVDDGTWGLGDDDWSPPPEDEDGDV